MAHDDHVDHPVARPSSASRRGDGWLRDLAYPVVGMAAGAAALYLSLVTMLIGAIPFGVGAWYVGREAGRHRLTFIGGLMIGIGACAWSLLGQAVTNRDPAVRYDPSTVPVLIVALAVGAIGLLLVAVGIVRARADRPA